MRTTYNLIAGRSVERLAALSDGVFAVAMTLLVLDLKTPASEAIHSEQGLWLALSGLAPKLMMYVMTFMMLGIFNSITWSARIAVFRGFTWSSCLPFP
jgi:uncharacterized membrane protein